MVAALVVPLLLGVRSVRYANVLMHFARRPLTAEDRAEARRAVGNLEDVVLRTSDGLTLHGWFAPGPRRATVVLVHGGANNRMDLFPEAALFARHGYGIFVYDSRDAGESDGEAITWGDGERRDLTAALDFVAARPEVDPGRVAVLGRSIGATTVAMTAAGDARPRAVVLYAVWPSLEREMRDKMGHRFGALSWWPGLEWMRWRGVDVDGLRPIDAVAKIAPRPLLFVAGGRDTDTPLPLMREMFDAAREPKELWIVPDAGHGGLFEGDPAGYEAHVVAFLDRTIGAR